MEQKRTANDGGAKGYQPIPLTSDLVFKYVFGAKQSGECLRSLLSAVQEDAGYPAVAIVQITNPFNLKDCSDDKLSIVDVKATDVTGATYTIEAQATYHTAFASRALYYWAQAYGGQLMDGEIYTHLQPVVGVNVMDFLLFQEEEAAPLHTTFQAHCREAPHLTALSDFIIHFIELPRIAPSDEMPSTAFGKWMYYIRYRAEEGVMEKPAMKAILEDTPEIRAAEERYQRFVADAELRDRHMARDKARRTHLQLLYDAEQKGLKQGLEQGLEKGLEKGREEGIEEGIGKGIEKGREEEKAKRRDAACKLKAEGFPDQKIAEIIDLPLEEIQGL